jgi:hypothetical protein
MSASAGWLRTPGGAYKKPPIGSWRSISAGIDAGKRAEEGRPVAKQKIPVVYEQTAARNAQTQASRTEAIELLHALLPKALKVLAEEMETGDNRLQAALHVLKACKLYGAEVGIGPTDAAEIALQEKEKLKERHQREYFASFDGLRAD